jgi:plastocyanin
VLSLLSKVAIAVGISLSIAAISSIYITMLASQNPTITRGSSGDSQSNNEMQQSSQLQSAISSSEAGNNTNMTSTITIPEGATAQNILHYRPDLAIVTPNSQVTWDNKDVAPHTATALDGSFDTGRIQPGALSSATVPSQGAIPYRCTIHPWMTAILQVSSSSFSSSAGGSSSSSSQQNETGAQQPQQQEEETQTTQSGNNTGSFNQTRTTVGNATEESEQSNITSSNSTITQNDNSSAGTLAGD